MVNPLRRANHILNDPWYRECVQRNAACEENRRFCRHDLQHMLDVARITYMLVLEGCVTTGNEITTGVPEDLPWFKILAGVGIKDITATTGKPGMLMQAKEVIYATGLLHDMARWVECETGEDHAVAGARMAGEVLNRAGFDGAEQRIIVKAISEHRTGGSKASLLGQYICRADDLARPCGRCAARDDCYKINRMETAAMLLY
ncbi:UTP:GlnB (protein PII) uridylyltransferase [Desulfoscipio gibsoniae DSM 7213]|uniref:UTP:GlnB (Protein PII) uridylyltransferase n=2 Tax=Desulfoscipio gibsoniae TaxID=102134 RepID=R4K9D1_9FIRM|nr:UTP:GlnB (protein PII) uridylyltransferase [Desulfoscipio gibsoniae DSM 7213]